LSQTAGAFAKSLYFKEELEFAESPELIEGNQRPSGNDGMNMVALS
jgi:hypothetical protein